MFPATCYPLNFILLSIIFSMMFEDGRTEESFECRSEFIPPGSRESVSMTCCSKIKLGKNNRIYWRNHNEALGTCTPASSKVHGYTCYLSRYSSDCYRIETCGPNWFAFGILRLQEADHGEYYITLTEGYSVLLAKKLVLNLTALETDNEHVVTMSFSSLRHTTTTSFPLSMLCSYSEQILTSSMQSPTMLAPENATESSSKNEYTSSSHITYLPDDFREAIATNIIAMTHSDVVTDPINESNVEGTNDDNKNVITILFILVIFAFLFGLVMCLYIIICKIRKFRKMNFQKQSKNGPDTKTNDCAEIAYENIVQSFHSRPMSNSPTDQTKDESSGAILEPGVPWCGGDRTSDDDNYMVKIYQADINVIPEIALDEYAYQTMDDLKVDNEDGEPERRNLLVENGSHIQPKEKESIQSQGHGGNATYEKPEMMSESAYCTHVERFKVRESDQDESEMEGHIALQDVYLFGHDLIGSRGDDESLPNYESIL